jgi:WXG100 family type VII secretion target
MSDGNLVIVQPEVLQQAIDAFNKSSSAIGECISSLQGNIGEVSSAWIAGASDTYQAKLQKLSGNITTAQTELQSQIKVLQDETERYLSTIKTVESNVDSLNSEFMK